jgi:hypothetical protein
MWSDSAASSKPAAQPDEAEDLKPDAADAVGQQHGKHDSHDQQHVDERGAVRSQDVALNQFSGVARMIYSGTDHRRQDGGGENSDTVGA